jgi:hypothetical protein
MSSSLLRLRSATARGLSEVEANFAARRDIDVDPTIKRIDVTPIESASRACDEWAHLAFCPNCSHKLYLAKCKARCPHCGFFQDCSDTIV